MPSDAIARENNFIAPPCPESRKGFQAAYGESLRTAFGSISEDLPQARNARSRHHSGQNRTHHRLVCAGVLVSDPGPTRFPAVKRSSGARFARRATVASSTKCRTAPSGASPCNSRHNEHLHKNTRGVAARMDHPFIEIVEREKAVPITALFAHHKVAAAGTPPPARRPAAASVLRAKVMAIRSFRASIKSRRFCRRKSAMA